MNKLLKDLKERLENGIAYKEGTIKHHSKIKEVPEPPIAYEAEDIRNIRKTRRYSQSVFAKILNVSIKTVQSWESGRRIPSHAALRLLEIIEKGIYQPQSNKKN